MRNGNDLLSKSKFKLAIQCQNQLFFSLFPKEYANSKLNDPFIQALAKGGFQVEALARAYFPEGKMNPTDYYDYQGSFAFTSSAFCKEEAVIFEAGFMENGLFALTDIVVKSNDRVELIEVKAKSYDPTAKNEFVGARGKIKPSWLPYLFDLAFQKELAVRCFPELFFTAKLLLVDKSKTASVDQLNQKFQLSPSGDPRKEIELKFSDRKDLGNRILSNPDGIDELVDEIRLGKHLSPSGISFSECIDEALALMREPQHQRIESPMSICKSCSYNFSGKDIENDEKKDGGKICMHERFGIELHELSRPNILEIWDHKNNDKLAEQGKFLLSDLQQEDIEPKPEVNKISRTERQWLQVEKSNANDLLPFTEKEALQKELKNWRFPLHFIDFETSMVALPFMKGMRPYEQIAFQYSHHILHQDGRIEHASQFLSAEPGYFPNFDFVRSLKKDLSGDSGTVFRYHNHEKTVLNQIKEQLLHSQEQDKLELISFIDLIANGKTDPDRAMVDLARVIRDYHYHPKTKGSNSLKAYLPAFLDSSSVLQERYSRSIGEARITSLNFTKDWKWFSKGSVQNADPYKQLEPVFSDYPEELIQEALKELDVVNNGGAAMIAYAKLQFQNLPNDQRDSIKKRLLQYCELDTLAMVMIYEGLRDIVGYPFIE